MLIMADTSSTILRHAQDVPEGLVRRGDNDPAMPAGHAYHGYTCARHGGLLRHRRHRHGEMQHLLLDAAAR